MPGVSSQNDDYPADAGKPSIVAMRTVVALIGAVAAAWIAAGSTGLLAHPLRRGLTWLALGVAIVAVWPRRGISSSRWPTLAAAVLVGLIMTASPAPALGVLAVAVVLAALCRCNSGLTARVLLLATLAATVLGIFRVACTSIPTVWLAADAIGRGLGWLGGRLAGRPLWIGASFGGIDFLVLTSVLYAGWLVCTSPPRVARAVYAALAIFVGHLIYLVVLALNHELIAALPEPVLPELSDNERLGVWAWGNAVRTVLPWNLPLLGGAIHAMITAAIFRWGKWLPVAEPAPAPGDAGHQATRGGVSRAIDLAVRFGPAVLAAAIPLLTVLALSRSDLKGKTVVAYEQGYLDWLKPEHDGQTAGMYGTLPMLIESLGGRFQRSADLSEKDLDAADILLLLHPNRPWSDQQKERVWDFVRRGGSLLLVAEPRIHQGELKSTFNDVLRPTRMQVEYDTAISQTGNWEHCCLPLAHPATAGIDDRRNWFGLLWGSSIRLGSPARPLLVGRWGWSDPGSDAAITGAFRYEPGEKLGDLVLAAEQRLGQGRVFVLGDAATLHNELSGDSYRFVGRVFGYLAGKSASPQAWWRQLLGLLATAGFLGLLCWRATPSRLSVAAIVLAASLVGCLAISRYAARVLPDGSNHSPNNLAYIDASHLEAYRSDTWGDLGLGGLRRTLMRNGYLPLFLPELISERLERAGLLISIGPSRPFSDAERRAVGDFVKSGGTFICMVGAEEAAASRQLLEDFDFFVPGCPVPPWSDARETTPLGPRRPLEMAYVDAGDYEPTMQAYAPWEVECTATDAQRLVWWPEGSTRRYFIITRPVGRGTVAVLGDTFLAVNQNLESAEGQLSENVAFWRWFLSRITGRKVWIPPKPSPESETPDDEVAP